MKTGMKTSLARIFVLSAFALSFSLTSFADHYPVAPDENLTPGSLCNTPSEYRYAERIPYCKRDVDSSLKWEIIKEYNSKLGYQIQDRPKYKIDHYIPLCMGGSNNKDNLWPQHESVYEITDQVEHETCEELKSGSITQKAAVELIREAKRDLKSAKRIKAHLQATRF